MPTSSGKLWPTFAKRTGNNSFLLNHNCRSEIQVDIDFLFVVPTAADGSTINATSLGGGDPGQNVHRAPALPGRPCNIRPPKRHVQHAILLTAEQDPKSQENLNGSS